jgi:RNA polymerase sigma-70 factor (ECF subfamily)
MCGVSIPAEQGKDDAFTRELLRAQSGLFVYLCALTGGDGEAARDMLQDTNLTLCREAERYDPARPFAVWARSVAYYQVLSWRKRQLRERLVFDDALLEEVAAELEDEPSASQEQLEALEGCLKKLPERMRSLFGARYADGRSVNDLAAASGRTPNAVAASLYRIRQLLSACIEDALEKKGRAAYVGR